MFPIRIIFPAIVIGLEITIPVLGQPRSPLPCEHLKKNGDGSWTATGDVKIFTQVSQIIMHPGDTLRPGVLYGNIDITWLIEQLEMECKQ